MEKARSVPFPFILENLFSLQPRVKPMFGCHAVYVGEKIMLIMRNKAGDHDHDNGIWISTKVEYHETLKEIFPSMRSIQVLGNGATNWQNLPLEADDFEESANLICELILKNDPRIGNVPKAKKSKKRATRNKKKG